MILITRDTESGQACEENGLPCILLKLKINQIIYP